MRKLGLSLAAILCMAFLASSAFAASLYNAGDKYAGILYDTSTIAINGVNWSNSGFGIKGGYFVTDNIDINAAYLFSNWSVVGLSGSSNVLDLMVDYHYPFSTSEKGGFGGFIGVGYLSLTINPPAGFIGTISGGSFAYEAGVEYKMGNNVGYGLYRGASPSLTSSLGGAAISSTVSSFEVGYNFMF